MHLAAARAHRRRGQRTWVKFATVAGVFEACFAQSMSRTPVQAVQASP